MKKQYLWMLAGLVVLLALVTGCGSSGSSSSGPNLGPGAALLIGANAGVLPAQGLTRQVNLGAKLDEGALVEVFNFATGQKLTSGTIGADGFARVTVTPGLTVVAVITGKRGDKPYRLSYIIPSVPNGEAQYVADPVSTLAAEALASKHFRTSLIDQDTLDQVTAAAAQYLANNPNADISLEGNLLASGTFGAQGTMKADELAPVVQTVPTTINNNVVRGKNAMRQISEASFPIAAMASGSSEAYEPFGKVIRDSLMMQFLLLRGMADMFTYMPEGIYEVLYPAIAGDWAYTPATTFTRNGVLSTKLFLLPMGTGFRFANGAITPDASLATPNQVTIEGVTYDDDQFRLVAKQVNSTLWQATLEMCGDTYVLDVPASALAELGTNPNMKGELSYTDAEGGTKKYTGTFIAAGTRGRSYSSASFTGTYTETNTTVIDDEFASAMDQLAMVYHMFLVGGMMPINGGGVMLMTRQEPVPTVTRTFTANLSITASFPAVLPPGADQDDSVYVYPTRVDVTDASAQLKLGTAYQSAMRGTAAVTFTNVMDDGNLDTLPLSINVTGTRTATTPDGTFQFNNAMQVTNTVLNAATDPEVKPLNMTLGDTMLKVTAGTEEISLSGKVQVDGTVETKNGVQDVRYHHARHDGKIVNTVSDTTYTGATDVTWGPSNAPLPKVSVTMTGTMTRSGYQAFNLNVAYNSDGQQTQTLTLHNLAYGYFSLNGSLVVNYNTAAEGSLQQKVTLKLTNQDGVQLLMERQRDAAPTGSLTVSGEVVGTLVPIENGMRMNYTDGTHDSATLDMSAMGL